MRTGIKVYTVNEELSPSSEIWWEVSVSQSAAAVPGSEQLRRVVILRFYRPEVCLASARVATWPLKQTKCPACAGQEGRLWADAGESPRPVAAIFIRNSAVKCVLEHHNWMKGVARRPAFMQINVILVNTSWCWDVPRTGLG